MALFRTQPVKSGTGPVHVNRFRIAFRRPSGTHPADLGRELLDAIPHVMDPNTARAEMDRSHPFMGHATLCFHGRAKIRVFDLPFIPLPVGPLGSTIDFPTPPALRHLELPPLHTDHVGAVQMDATGLTVQTLTRLFDRPEDAQIVAMAEQQIRMIVAAELAAGALGVVAALGTELLAPALLNYALFVNRHHFLAGRRSFRMGPASDFGAPAGGEGVWVFETAAVERFARPEFETVTNYLLGGDKAALGPIWKEMCRKLATRFGTIVPSRTSGDWTEENGVLFVQKDLATLGEVHGAIASFSNLHPAIFDPS